MGERAAAETNRMTKRKKKGRPSLLDLQKRSLKLEQQQQQQQQQQQLQRKQNPNSKQNPNPPPPPLNQSPSNASSSGPRRRSTRHQDEDNDNDDEDDDEDQRKAKKHKLLLGLNLSGSVPNEPGAADTPEADLKRRKIAGSNDAGGKDSKPTDTLHGSSVEPGPKTPLPDKKLLVFILDRLQKKDTYGVFSEPVDPEELPDYHDIIEHPMDFSTVRKKLDGEAYATLEQFEKDIFLICSNAMQYNSPDTVYFRQARSIQELAKKDFENLRQDSDDSEPLPQPQPQPKVVRRGRQPKLKKPIEGSQFEHSLEFSSGATIATGGDIVSSSTGYNSRGTTSYKHQPDSFLRASHGSHGNESYAAWLSEWENEFPASVWKAVLKYGKKPFTIDENRRDTYRHTLASINESSVLTTFDGELKQLMVVGLNSEHGYARSLVRFAADLGPVVWKIASKKIENVLPVGVEFGPGWAHLGLVCPLVHQGSQIQDYKSKRSLKLQQRQQQQLLLQHKQQNPNFNQNPKNPLNHPPPANASSASRRRSTRRHPNSYAPEWIGGDDDEEGDDHDAVEEEEEEVDDDDDERKQKKHKLLLGLNPLGLNLSGSDSNAAGGDNPEADLKRRKIAGSNDVVGGKVSKATDTLHGSSVELGPTTPLPDKKLLVFILDRLQKKDTYGVFSEPVDPEELPDYHDIIEHPMDFSTVRKKLDGGAYTNLEQFEKDIFLICSNAMQYNSPDTIYFRQARTIQELAKKDFENLRQDSDDSEPLPQPQAQPKVVRRGRPPKLKKPIESSPFERIGPEFSSGATLATGGDNTGSSTGYNLRKTTSYKHQPDSFLRSSHGSHSNETYAAWLSEWENEFPASVVKAVLRYGKKPFAIDENRRDTYRPPSASINEPSVLTTFEGELKQLMVVGLNAEHGYARSLARFAADLGPVAWKIASKKIENVLPVGVEFGPGWVGENKEVEGQLNLFSDQPKVSCNAASNSHINGLQPMNTGARNAPVSSRDSAWSREDLVHTASSSKTELSAMSTSAGGSRPMSSYPDQQKSVVHSNVNGLTGGFGYNCSPQMGAVMLGPPAWQSGLEHAEMPSQMFGMAPTSNSSFCSLPGNGFASKQGLRSSELVHSGNSSTPSSTPDLHALPNGVVSGKSSWSGLSQYHQPDFVTFPPDLNVGFLAPSSPSSGVPIGSPQQPDLALQL
ncbi:hypothetical protein Tsubulata_027972 [Turnera subulata]|uniref:Bromo domain-containing protein n=1 Tax=Turnera subulata TaxID=218843 RepID=A0A9Q0F9Q1_9ROSI|nr:hypothetical protein Tsubulata_027972 [Turnera subulata]